MSSICGEDDQSPPSQAEAPEGSSNESSGEFKVGEWIRCFHSTKYYKARITNIERSKINGSLLYCVHYHGWNKNWDEWVPVQLLAPFNDEEEEIEVTARKGKLKEFKARAIAEKQVDSSANVGRPNTVKKSGPKGRRSLGVNKRHIRQSTREFYGYSDLKVEHTSVQLTSTLVDLPPPVFDANQLDDQFHFNKEKKLKVPVAEGLVTVHQLLEDWAEARRVNPPPNWNSWSGLLMARQTRSLFNGFCHRVCLTDVEMLQAGMMLERHKSEMANEEAPKFNNVELCDETLSAYDISPYHPVHHLVRLMLFAPTIFMKHLSITDSIAKSICKVYWQDLAEYINKRIDEVLLDERYYVEVTKEDVDFISEGDDASVKFYFSKLAICKQKVDKEKEKQAEQQQVENPVK